MKSDEITASDYDENTQDDDDDKSLCYDGDFTPFKWELQSQNYYWGNINKDILAKAMHNHPTGTFAVRDASTPGDYTLTVRINNANKLVRIYVVDGKIGFTHHTLDFDSVVDLIDYYKNNSLEEHNSALKTSLKFPLVRGSRNESPMPTVEDEAKIVPPDQAPLNLVVAAVNPATLTDDAKREYERKAAKFVLHHFLDSVLAEMLRSDRRHNQISNQLETLDIELNKHKKALSGFVNVHALLKANHAQLQKNLNLVDNVNKESVATNTIVQDRRIKNVEEMRDKLQISLDGIERIRHGLGLEDELMIKRKKIIQERCERYTQQYKCYDVNKELIENQTKDIQRAIDRESEKLQQNLLKANLATSAFDWLTMNPEKSYSTELIQKSILLMKKRGTYNTNGSFLIRPSASRDGCFALVLSMNEVIYNCLIEYKDPSPENEFCGYAFMNTDLFYTTLSDFIRYYSLVTLREHNPQLDTVLRIPILKYLSSVRKRRQIEGYMDEEEERIINEISEKIDSADCFAFDEIQDHDFELKLTYN